MPNASDIAWFKQQFSGKIIPRLASTPFDVDMFAALACQETGEVWPRLRKAGLPVDRILALCVGDTIDGRSCFPRSRAELEGVAGGGQMFGIGHDALVAMAEYIPEYRNIATKKDKFCHGYGMFQYDIQFFKNDPDYFLERRWEQFDQTFGRALEELQRALKKLGWQGRSSLTDLEKAAVAIAYNRGSYAPSRGLKQGHFDGQHYYGENFYAYLRLARTVPTPGDGAGVLPQPQPGSAILAPPSAPQAREATHEVVVNQGVLNVRSAPERDAAAPSRNIVGQLPAGQRVAALGGETANGFLEIETSLRGALIRGFVASQFLRRLSAPMPPPARPAPSPPADGIVAVSLPQGSHVTRRDQPASALSLNEPGQPTRSGTSPLELTASLGAIIAWLAVDRPAHRRYQPKGGTTFCNIYAHDYCTLAGVYLPRVWWSGSAIERLAKGEKVEPLYGATVDEQRANDLFRWLRDFGLRFGWRQTGTLTKLQSEVNLGAIGLIVARRKEEGRSGHIVAVVPETGGHSARRDGAGEVIAPLQSQAGTVNFQYGTGTFNWWRDERFAESAFWLHA